MRLSLCKLLLLESGGGTSRIKRTADGDSGRHQVEPGQVFIQDGDVTLFSVFPPAP
jgi:hypothetical protein